MTWRLQLGVYNGYEHFIYLTEDTPDYEFCGHLHYNDADGYEEVPIVEVWKENSKTYFDEVHNSDDPIEHFGITTLWNVVERMDRRWQRYASRYHD